MEVNSRDELVANFPLIIGQKPQFWQDVVYEKKASIILNVFTRVI